MENYNFKNKNIEKMIKHEDKQDINNSIDKHNDQTFQSNYYKSKANDNVSEIVNKRLNSNSKSSTKNQRISNSVLKNLEVVSKAENDFNSKIEDKLYSTKDKYQENKKKSMIDVNQPFQLNLQKNGKFYKFD